MRAPAHVLARLTALAILSGCGRIGYDPLLDGAASRDGARLDDGAAYDGSGADAAMDAGPFDCTACPWACTAGACDDAVTLDTYGHQCVVHESGRLSCWGRNGAGELGDGTTADRNAPFVVPGIGDAVDVAVGAVGTALSNFRGHTCIVTRTGTVRCWGNNGNGQLGNGTTADSLTPVDVTGVTDAVEIDSLGEHVCVRHATGAVSCWGRNGGGQVGDGSMTDRRAPVPVSGLSNVAEITTGLFHSCVRRTSGEVLCWGNNLVGAVGNGRAGIVVSSPESTGLTDAEALSSGGAFSCATRALGRTSCWGQNQWGEIGDGTTTERRGPVLVTAIGAHAYMGLGTGVAAHTCGIHSAGEIDCWGNNNEGQLGDGTTTSRTMPGAVVGVANARLVFGGFERTLVILDDGSVVTLGVTNVRVTHPETAGGA